MQKAKVYFFLLLSWLIFIFVMSSFESNLSDVQSNLVVDFISSAIPSSSSLNLVFIVRKVAHFLEYALLGFLFALNFHTHHKNTLYSVPASLFYAITDEFHQLFVSGRSAQPLDILIDILGASFGLLIFYLFQKIHSK